MKNTEKLLSITNLKKYFPVAKTKWFQKEQLYVRANEDITIDIFSGETFGLVGESGSGKTTIGRAIIRINPVYSVWWANPAAVSPRWAEPYFSYTIRLRAAPCITAARWRILPPNTWQRP